MTHIRPIRPVFCRPAAVRPRVLVRGSIAYCPR